MRSLQTSLLVYLLVLISGCGQSEDKDSSQILEETSPPVLEVMAADYAFQAPDTIQSGWTTLRLINEQGMEIHELGLAMLPEGKHLSDYMNEIMPAWENILVQLQKGEIETSEIGPLAYEMLPDWNSDIAYVKSRGMVSPGYSTDNIMYLEPGTYMIECWVKDANGKIHISNGMIRELTVLDESNEAEAPESSYSISLTEGGIETSEEIKTGTQIVSVDFESNEEGQLFYDDVHLVRVNQDTDFASINEWMGWYQAGGLRAPAPVEFLGGADVYGSLPYGGEAYFTVHMNPGTYAWVVHSPAEVPVYKTFSID